jgi:arginyl-tRNA synthetase
MVENSPPGPADPAPGDPWAPFVRAAIDSLRPALAGLVPTGSWDALEDLLELEGGPEADLAFPTFRAAALAKVPPPELAQRLVGAMAPSPLLPTVSAKGGYVNFRVEPTELVRRTLSAILAGGARYGQWDPVPGAFCVEHTSANPTGPFHIGRVRNAIIGDTLARLLRAAGRPVTTQYYIDDMGRQSAMITWVWSQPRAQWPESVRKAVDGEEVPGEKADRHRGRPYPAVSAYLKDHPEAAQEVADLVARLESGDPPPEHRALAQSILEGMLASLERLGIRFDEFVWESSFVRDGSVDRVLARLRAAPHAVREENGALAIDASSYKLPKDSARVVVQRGNGTSLYVTRDIAYHLVKFARFEHLVDVLGQDHQLHARTLDALLTEIGETRHPQYLIYQDITVPEGGRMSTRGGSAVWLDHLLDEAVTRATKEVRARREDLSEGDIGRIAEAVATGAVRYHVVRVAPEKPVVFRWEDALSFEGRSGPFVQYSYARASSVLRKGSVDRGPYPFDASRLAAGEEYALVRVLARMPRAVLQAVRTAHVHAIAGYAHDVADQFNRFYHAVPVLSSGEERASRIALVAATRQTLGNALDLLGIARLDTM